MQQNSLEQKQIVIDACEKVNNNAERMIDILWHIQDRLGHIPPETWDQVATLTNTYRVEVEGVVSFYAFFHEKPQGKFIIRVCEDIIDQHAGMKAIVAALEVALKIKVGETTPDGLFSLHLTPCIGMSDQGPAALINEQVITHLTPSKIQKFVRHIQKNQSLKDLPFKTGDGRNAHPLIQSEVNNNVRQTDVVLGPHKTDSIASNIGLKKALQSSPEDVIQIVRMSNLRGRGGAGFPTARKWQLAADTPAKSRVLICNADEGEPGTFKDRVLLTEKAELLIEGMTIAAYAIGADQGILYLRAEYRYLHAYLESLLQARRQQGLLGNNIEANSQFNFDIRIQLGAGAYICGEESSLISSCEGKRGEPKNKPPFPAQSGYLGLPTVVNNVETLCNLPLILRKGPDWFAGIGTRDSAGTKLLSICGDCEKPGVYEFPMGITVQEVLDKVGAQRPAAVQVGGASGTMIGRTEFHRRLCFEDLPTAGAIMVFNDHRNILKIVDYFMHFFIEESCGYCTPCRVGNVFLKKGLEKIMQGMAETSDLTYLKDLSHTIIETSRCGLGHTSPNPILTSLQHFPMVYAALLKENEDGIQPGFDIQKALDESRIIARRRSLIYDPQYEESK